MAAKHTNSNVPADPPMKDFWSFTIYDNQTRSMLQTDQRFPGIDNNKEGLVQNDDGSWDIFIGPEPPEGYENNWIQTVPGKGWNTIFRLYGPPRRLVRQQVVSVGCCFSGIGKRDPGGQYPQAYLITGCMMHEDSAVNFNNGPSRFPFFYM